ncbi:unnamed protein product [Rotaria socialis]|uniref:EGF-like domain-containing protein n=1 Tax=Rotaria socialis TaxID=392032 RepID=A0A819URX3_9BILA|nr:unnamed protein product [Rotaria socialis]CAF4217117.1 unnamed protein product [Rotaria socialis]CAF4503952.1 unnamed protein product [Rotaria socialis]CAF4649082.1 unnamed protein product [Rotaria socialis]
MIYRIFSIVFIFIHTINNVQTASIPKRGNEVLQILKDIKEKVKEGTQCLPPSKYFAGSCYTYMKLLASSWEEAHDNCLSLPKVLDARLLVIDSIAEYEFVERDLIGRKSGSDSVSVYLGLRKMNDTWLWSNNIPLQETSLNRYWVDNNEQLAYECGIIWLARNISLLTAAACAEQALRPYVCKHTIDRCYNNSGGCGKYGTCVNIPLMNSYKCRCRFLYSGDRCDGWSSQGLQAIVGGIIIIIAFVGSYFINLDRTGDQWSFRKSTVEHYQAATIYSQSRPTSYMPRTPNAIDRIIRNPCLPDHPDFVDMSIENEKLPRHSSSSTPPPFRPPIEQPLERKHRYSFRLSVQEFEISSHIQSLFIKPKRLILISLPIALTIAIGLTIFYVRRYVKNHIHHSSYSNSTGLFQFCTLYENNYYVNLLTLPIAVVIIIIIICNQTRIAYYRFNRKRSTEKFSIYSPIPFNPFSKVNRFDTMVLSGIVSHEILQIIEEIFLKATQIKILTMSGPLFDLVRQIGLVIIIGMRYYPVYTVIEMTNANVLYYALCALYMWTDLILRVFEQSYCVDIGPLIRTWHKLQQLQNETASKLATSSFMQTTMTTNSNYDRSHSSSRLRTFSQKTLGSLSIGRPRPLSTTMPSTLQPNLLNTNPSHSLNWSSIYLNYSFVDRNESQSTFDQFNIDSSVIGILKYAPYYLCLTYICLRLTYLKTNGSHKQSSKHIYHEPDLHSSQKLSVEYRYVRHLLQKTQRTLIENNKKIPFFKSLFYKIYRPNKYFNYSKQILNMYMIAFMLTYYLTFNILQGGFYIIEKIYSIFSIPLIVLTENIDIPLPKPMNLKYEIILACILTAIIYYGQLLWGMKNYQKHMLDVYKGNFIDIPPRSAFKSARLISQHAHYPGYCLAYLGFGYITMGNIIFVAIIILRVIWKNLFLFEQVAKVVIPILVIYLSKCILIWFLSRTFFLQKHGQTIALKNLRSFFVFSYFNFFFDCFLGIISCGLRVTKATIAAIVFLPRLDYCIFGRTLEKLDTGFISYVSFIHMECLHTHPVLVYFCSLVNDKVDRRNEYSRSNKREIRHTEMFAYTRRQRAMFRWYLAYTLVRNTHLVQLRKYQVLNLQLSAAESFNEFLERTVFNRFQSSTLTRFPFTKSQATLSRGGIVDSNTIIRNQKAACTSLLLGNEEHDERKPSF